MFWIHRRNKSIEKKSIEALKIIPQILNQIC